MKKLDTTTADLIDKELKSIPEKYHKNFNSTHEGYAVLLEEVRELEHVVFFGEKECKNHVKEKYKHDVHKDVIEKEAEYIHRNRLREEAVQIAAMAVRIIQELT